MDKAKPFCIPKRAVWEAYKRVRANGGAAGVDGQTIKEFEENLKDNLFKLWNRMSSGSYFPPPVRRVEIPKDNGTGMRPLGIPTVSVNCTFGQHQFGLGRDLPSLSPTQRSALPRPEGATGRWRRHAYSAQCRTRQLRRSQAMD